ncbi:hypothetical protein FCM35_KLT16693 [Carex littledalei]|uniref:Uncharacterized protein n=1 Tax=Carex littledalei TaxID=544730 RepID=A0A833VGL7_9POAL|nr:hypothetical protein FCM35_KLT16693 [Carex littledalei]
MGTLKVLLVTFFVALSISVAFSYEAREEETSKLPLKESDQESSIEERSKELKSKDEAASKLEIKTNKWIPVAQEKWVVLKANTEPYIQLVSSKSVEMYKTAKIATAPHFTKFQQVTAPQVQKVKKISKPYIDQAADLIKKVHTEPYIQMVSSKPVELYKTAKIATAPHITKFQEVTAPHIQKVKKISKPYINQASNLIKKVHTEPYIQMVSSKPVELYKAAKIATAPHITKFQEVTAPHIQKVKKISKPYIDQAADLIKVHNEPYIKMVSSKPVELYKTAKIATAPHITKFQEVTAPHIQKVKKISKPYIDQAAVLIKKKVKKISKPYIDQAADLIKKVHPEPYIQLVSSKSVELYKTAKFALKKKRDALEAQSIVSDDKARELSAQLESFKETNKELKKRIKKTERALKAAEVHGAWLPPWLATQMACYMAVMSAKWNEHVKPVMDNLAVCYVIHVFAETFLVARLQW